ncbi:protein adenylyltransferase Fic [Diorhabda carinulata]|uniref:protein adenylyltransferase Fic n=1 Tax=Diorhabda carinulata TaxID=1163345 RepID=UPI0025A0C75F|nr:protein adenylyltransferase Fic [Diorhabda carinulata]
MNIFLIVISILLSIICALVALLQHYYFFHELYRRPSLKYDVSVFEDLIPSEKDDKYRGHNFPLQPKNDDTNTDFVLSHMNYALESQSKYSVTERYSSQHAETSQHEVDNALQAAIAFQVTGKTFKALKLFLYAATLAPQNADVLNTYGEFLEQLDDIVTADELYFKALTHSPNHKAALTNRARTAPLVEGLDYQLFKDIDERNNYLINQMKVDTFVSMKTQAFYLHIYHTVGIEGNTMTVEQLKYLLETGQVVEGKSLMEHNEILGLEKAMLYIKLLIRIEFIGLEHILGIHRRVMGHVDPLGSGMFRKEKVYVGSHVPPPHGDVPALMEIFVQWLNSEEALSMHPVRYAALAHYKLVDIHPFTDGNGRTSRLLMNLLFLRRNYPPVIVLKEQRQKYYDALKTANMGDVRPFVRFVARCTLKNLDMYIYTAKYLSSQRGIDSDDTKKIIVSN